MCLPGKLDSFDERFGVALGRGYHARFHFQGSGEITNFRLIFQGDEGDSDDRCHRVGVQFFPEEDFASCEG